MVRSDADRGRATVLCSDAAVIAVMVSPVQFQSVLAARADRCDRCGDPVLGSLRPMAAVPQALLEVLRTVLAPLVEADGGQLYLVSADNGQVRLHLAGTCCGCPGAEATSRQVITPAVQAVAPDVQVEVTNGWLIPEGAKRVESAKS